MRRGLAAGVVVVALVVGGPVVAVARSRGAMPKTSVSAVRYRLIALAGSAGYLAYARYATRDHGRRLVSGSGVLFALSRAGRSVRVARYHAGYDVTLDRSLLMYGTGPDVARWVNLRTGMGGRVSEDGDDLGPIAAPNGWVVGRPSPSSTTGAVALYDDKSSTGVETSLGEPEGNDPAFEAGNGLWAAIGSDNLVAFADNDEADDSKVVTMSFAHPGSYRTLLPDAAGGSLCRSVTSQFAACAVQSSTSRATGHAVDLLALDGHRIVKTTRQCALQDYQDAPAVLHASAAWITEPDSQCSAGHLKVLAVNGRVRTSTRSYSPLQQPTTAFGEIIVADSSRRHLEELTNANAKPKTLVPRP